MAARISGSLTDLRQAKVLSGDAVVHACVLFTKNAQAGKLRVGLKAEKADAVPDSKIYEICHHEVRHPQLCTHVREIID